MDGRRTLSFGGKEVLIKAGAQAIPTYAMSVFKFPKKNCKGITDAISHYWWGDGQDQHKLHWFAWWKICVAKVWGGMGFRDPEAFNQVLLVKQAWWIL